MNVFFSEIKSKLSLLPEFTLGNLLEVAIISFLVYRILLFLKNSHAFTVLKGVFVVLVFTAFAYFCHLHNILWIIEKISATAVIALVVIFQPELRKAMENLGKQKFVSRFVNISENDRDRQFSEKTLNELAKGVFDMAKVKTGALIVLKQQEDLDSYIESGIRIDGIVTSALLVNTFEKNTPLHDGAAIIIGNRMAAATCYLPLSQNEEISKDLGTRHRAAIGMSEATDALIIVVSEETGHVSIAKEGELTRISGIEDFKASLKSLVVTDGKEKKKQHRNKKEEEKK